MEVLLLPNLTCDLTCDLTNRNWSSRNYWEKIEVPMVYINALDDPLIPPKMLEPVRQLAGNARRLKFFEITNFGQPKK